MWHLGGRLAGIYSSKGSGLAGGPCSESGMGRAVEARNLRRPERNSVVTGCRSGPRGDSRLPCHNASREEAPCRECTSFARRKPPKRPLRWRRRARLLLASTGTLPRCANPELVSTPHLCSISLRLQSARKQPAGSQTKDRLLFRILSQKQKVDTLQRDIPTTGRRLIQERDHTRSLWDQRIQS